MFLDAPSHLYKRSFPSVRRSVRRSVGPELFLKVKSTHTRRILCRVSGLVWEVSVVWKCSVVGSDARKSWNRCLKQRVFPQTDVNDTFTKKMRGKIHPRHLGRRLWVLRVMIWNLIKILAHSFTCSSLLALLPRSAALTRSLAHFAHSWDSERLDGYLFCVFFSILDHSAPAQSLKKCRQDIGWQQKRTALRGSR